MLVSAEVDALPSSSVAEEEISLIPPYSLLLAKLFCTLVRVSSALVLVGTVTVEPKMTEPSLMVLDVNHWMLLW